jgi:hypothetical protein
MQKEEIITFVVDELAKQHSRNEIIRRLCERTGMMWPDAEKLVRQIEADHGQDIRARQSPLLVALSVAIFIGGVGSILYCAVYFISFANTDAITIPNPRGVVFAIGALFTGITMIAGSLFGLRQTIKELFEDKENR